MSETRPRRWKWVLAGLALFVSGLGLGQIIASTNILAGRRYREHTAALIPFLL